MAKALEVVSRADVLIGKMMKGGEWRLLRYLDRLFVEELYPVVKGRAVKYSGQDDLPFPVLVARLERLEEDPRGLLEVRGEGAHQRDERPLAGPPLRLRALLEEEVQGGAGARHSASTPTPTVLESYDKFLTKEAAR